MTADVVPGVMRCAKCKFVLHRVTLYVQSGGVSAGDNKTEPCPNGCGPLWPMTWQQNAEELQERCEEMLDRAVAAESAIHSALRAADAGDLPAVRGALGAFRSSSNLAKRNADG